ncbi:MAG: 3' terminal RNA ribose 2'-O-methyltransferase Hen1 [Planctomycetes bacterium]|nr:3' terminal RNA ribose 2'-O-methyltransferase Hen1 [Planctomycetota bacterium]
MLLTIANTTAPADDLGYLLHKHPAKVQRFDLAFGQAHVFYPEVATDRTTAALLLDIDPVGLVRNRRGPSGEGHTLDQYVNDRPYVASSFLSVAIAQVYGSALGGRCKDRPEAVDRQLDLEVMLAVVPCRGGEPLLRALFEPLGYEVNAEGHALDYTFLDWGDSSYFTVTLRAQTRLANLLSHLYVLIPVLDNDKHYWVAEDEVEKLLRHGKRWLADHPAREQITHRYLKHQRGLARQALARLIEEEDPDPDEKVEVHSQEEEEVERPISLNEQRLSTVCAVIANSGAQTVVDLGCGEGKLIRELMKNKKLAKVVGLDVSHRALEVAADRLHLDRMSPKQRERIDLIHGSLTYRDKRLNGFDAATVIEVIEHLDPARLRAFERVVFEFARPGTVIVTTPNIEYNARFETLPAGQLRHKDHRFEWNREQFQAWAHSIAERFGYAVRFLPVGPEDAQVGPPTQAGVFIRMRV